MQFYNTSHEPAKTEATSSVSQWANQQYVRVVIQCTDNTCSPYYSLCYINALVPIFWPRVLCQHSNFAITEHPFYV